MSIMSKIRAGVVIAALSGTAGCLYGTGGGFVLLEPPAPRAEVIVAQPGPEYVWVAGYWSWADPQYVWVPGRWAVPPRNYVAWEPGGWVREERGWRRKEGHWKKRHEGEDHDKGDRDR